MRYGSFVPVGRPRETRRLGVLADDGAVLDLTAHARRASGALAGAARRAVVWIAASGRPPAWREVHEWLRATLADPEPLTRTGTRWRR